MKTKVETEECQDCHDTWYRKVTVPATVEAGVMVDEQETTELCPCPNNPYKDD